MSEQTTKNQSSNTLRVFANIISYIFHPVFMPAMMTFVLYKLSPQSFAGFNVADFSKQPFPILAPVIINTLLFPLIAILLLKGVGFIKSLKLEDQKERIIPLIITMVFYFWAYWAMKNVNAPFLLRVLLLGCFWAIIALFMINIFFKISMHTAAAGGAIAMIVILMLHSPVNMVLPLFITILTAGIIGSARLVLHAHNRGQVWLGYIIGFFIQMSAYWYLS